MSNILPKDSSKVSYTQKLIVSKEFDNFAKITFRVTETGPSRIQTKWSCFEPNQLILTYSPQIGCNFNHYLAKQSLN